MPDGPINLQGQALASEILRAIEAVKPPRGVVLSALTYCQNQIENRTIVETAILVAGCSTTDFLCSGELELYYGIAMNGEEIAFIYKGWDDPGFRLGELVTISADEIDRFDEVKKFCDINGVVMSFQENEDSEYEVTLEQVIYSTGFDGRTFAQALSTMIECSNKLKRC